MARASGAYKSNETQIYAYIRNTMKLNKAIACGILANIDRESSYNHTATNKSSGAYGLCQWLGPRKTDLVNWCNKNKLSFSTVYGQMCFMNHELTQGNEQNAYRTIKNQANTKAGAEAAGYNFSANYERHGSDSENRARRTLAGQYFDAIDDQKWLSGTAVNHGDKILSIARQLVQEHASSKKHPYSKGGNSPGGFDAAGLVHYCYKTAGLTIPDLDTKHYYELYKDTAEKVDSTKISAGDLVFTSSQYYLTNGVDEVSIATGEGTMVTSTSAEGVVEKTMNIGRRPMTILRILNHNQTTVSISNIPDWVDDGSDLIFATGANYSEAVVRFPYDSKISANLSRVEQAGFDYGYLIDIVNGGEFKFYIPEFIESAGANWEGVEIVGRSVTVMAYKNTNSRTVDISLELYAGEGIYKADPPLTDPVGILHKDVNFLKSLEYPDYTHPITRPPSIVQLILGSAFNMIGVVSGVSINHLKPLDTQNRSMYVKVSFKVTQIAQDPPDYTDIRDGSYAATSTKDISTLETK